MLKGKYFAGILAASVAVFVLPFYVALFSWLHALWAAGFLLLLSLSFFVKNRYDLPKKGKLTLLVLSTLLLGAAFGYGEAFLALRVAPANALSDDTLHTVEATVADVRYAKPYGAAYVVETVSIDGDAFSVGAVLEVPFDADLTEGDTISVEAYLTEISGTYALYHRSQGILLSMTAEEVAQTGHEPSKPTIFDTIRSYISENFEAHIGGKSSGYATALLTGNKDALDGATSLAYQRLGISHILAVSGMHFSVIVGGLDLLLRALTLPKKRKNVILMLFALFFAGVCGFSASVLRALIMFCIYYLAELFGEKSDPLTSLLLAVGLIVSVNPWSVYDTGLWLSFFSTLGILLVMPSLQCFLHREKPKAPIPRLGKRVCDALCTLMVMNLTALFFTMPVTYFLFGSISLVSPLANLIFIPLTELILYLLILLTLTGFIPFVAPLLGAFCRILIEATDGLAQMLSDLRGIVISIRYPFAGVILLLLIFAVLLILFFGELRPRRLAAVFLSSALLFALCLGVYTALGRGDTHMLLHTDGKSDVVSIIDDGEVLLMDVTTGGKRTPLMAAEALADYYRCEIDTYVLTHLHPYHAGTLNRLSEEIKLHRVLIPTPETEREKGYARAIEEVLADTVTVEYYERDGTSTVSVGDTTVTLPPYETLARSEHPVITFSAETDGVPAWLYCGASSMESEAMWEKATQYRVVILGTNGPKVRHLFADDCLSSAELVLFTSRETMSLCDTEALGGKAQLVETQYHIVFEH